MGQSGLFGTGVGDGQPVVPVGRPQHEFDKVSLLAAGAVPDGVGDQLRGQQTQIVSEAGPEEVRQRFGNGLPGPRRTEAGWAGKRQ